MPAECQDERTVFGSEQAGARLQDTKAGEVNTMDSLTVEQTTLIAVNRREYGNAFEFLTFPDPDQAAAAAAERAELLAWLDGPAQFGYRGTKVDCRRLSPGCQACGAGSWACLFVNGRCNCSCFYCPSPQDDAGPPVTNGLVFTAPEDFAAYVARFGFTGASFSGGEPLLTPERTLAYLAAVRRHCGDGVHLWLYTNGTLLTADLCRQLRAEGLDEIRFDLGAVGYDLTKLRLAVGIIPTVTVEVPAVPEEEGLLRQKMGEMVAAGVDFLNLHQLRLTPHNLRHLAGRGYTFLHGEKVTVLESELTALRLLRHALENGLGLPVNYCSFPYKRRFQHAGARRRGAATIRSGWEGLTEAGFLRTLTLSGAPETLAGQAAAFAAAGGAAGSWHREPGDGKLHLSIELWPLVDRDRFGLAVRYSEAAVVQTPSYRAPFEKLTLPSGASLYVERRPVSPLFELRPAEADAFGAALLTESGTDTIPPPLLPFERIPAGLADYF